MLFGKVNSNTFMKPFNDDTYYTYQYGPKYYNVDSVIWVYEVKSGRIIEYNIKQVNITIEKNLEDNLFSDVSYVLRSNGREHLEVHADDINVDCYQYPNRERYFFTDKSLAMATRKALDSVI